MPHCFGNILLKLLLVKVSRMCIKTYAIDFSINFSRGGELLCCCSDKGTLHVFQIGGIGGNSGSSLIAASGAFLGGERPFASGAIPREQPALCAFISNTSVAG